MPDIVYTAEHVYDQRDADALKAWFQMLWRKHSKKLVNEYRDKPLTNRENSLEAYISRNLWVVDCDKCLAGNAVHPEWPESHCFDCGTTGPVRFPSNYKAIERALLARPYNNRNWTNQTTVGQLIQENRDHGIEDS